MPYRRLPKTDASRLKALKTLLDNNDIYTARDRFIDWKDINNARTAHDRLLTLVKQYEVDKQAQSRGHARVLPLQRNASMYLSHFMQVLRMCIERGEIKKTATKLYSLPDDITVLPPIQVIGQILEWGPKIINGEKERIKQGGRPIYNPTIGMVSTHFDIFREEYEKHCLLQQRTREMESQLKDLRPGIDELIERIWNQIEQHFMGERVIDRVEDCERFGVKYYYRRKELKAMREAEANSSDKE